MSRRWFTWGISLIIIAAVTFTAFRLRSGQKCMNNSECPSSNEKEQNEKKSASGLLIFEAVARQLLSSVNS